MPSTPFSMLAFQQVRSEVGAGPCDVHREDGGNADADDGKPETRVEHSSGSLEWRCRDRVRRWAREGSLQNGGLDAAGSGTGLEAANGSGLRNAASAELLVGEPSGSPRCGGGSRTLNPTGSGRGVGSAEERQNHGRWHGGEAAGEEVLLSCADLSLSLCVPKACCWAGLQCPSVSGVWLPLPAE